MIHGVRKALPLSVHAIRSAFRTDGFIITPYRIEEERIHAGVDAFFRFLALPQRVKDPLHYHVTDILARGGRVGYKHSDAAPEEGDPDGKEVFQYHPSIEKRWLGLRETIPELHALLTAMRAIYEPAAALIDEVVRGFADSVPDIKQAWQPEGEYPAYFLRVIKYNRRTTANNHATVACGHYDIGDITAAIAESSPTLWGGGDEGTPLQRIGDRQGRIALLAGYGFPQALHDETLMPTWHGADYPNEPWNETCARWAWVLFAGRNSRTDVPSWEQTHTRRGSEGQKQSLPA